MWFFRGDWKGHEVIENESELSGEAERVCKAVLRVSARPCSDARPPACGVFSVGPSPRCRQGQANVEAHPRFKVTMKGED